MEASSSAHWARKLATLGLDARITSAQPVEPYRSQGSSGNNDADDAAAICEATRISVRSMSAQSIRTWCGNALIPFGLQRPRRPRVITKVENLAALPYARMPAFMTDLRKKPGMAAMALDLTIRTACRTGEVTGATWPGFDLDAGIWTIPAKRMKAGVEHTVPLDAAMLAVLDRAEQFSGGKGWAFPSARKGRPLSNVAMLELVRGMGAKDATGKAATVHGFRPTFRQRAAECPTHPREVAEHAFAHRLPDKVEAAYSGARCLKSAAGYWRTGVGTLTPLQVSLRKPPRKHDHRASIV